MSVEIAIGATEPIACRLISDGNAVSGAGVDAYVVRASDGFWYDWTTHTFADYATVIAGSPTIDLLADASDPSRYVYAWDTSQITNPLAGGDLYVVTYEVSSPFTAKATGEIDTRAIAATRSGLALASALATAQAGIDTLLAGVTVAAGALTSTAIGSGFVATVQSGLSTLTAAGVWAVTDGTMTKGAALDLLRRRVTNKRVLSALGVLSFFADDGSTVEKTSTVRDVGGTAVSPATGEASQASAEA